MPYKNIDDFINFINRIDTHGHAEVVKKKMAALQLIQEQLSVIWNAPLLDDTDNKIVAKNLTSFCENINKTLIEYGAIFAEQIDTVEFDRTASTTFQGQITRLATSIAKKQAILLEKTALYFLDEKNIDTVRDAVDKDCVAAQAALNTATAQIPQPDREHLQTKLDELKGLIDIVDRIRAEAQRMSQCRKELQKTIAAESAGPGDLKKAMTDYNAAVTLLNKSLSDYNRQARNDYKIFPPVSPPTRELSTARIAANWSVQIGVDGNGIGHGICTDKEQINRLTLLAGKASPVPSTLMNGGTDPVKSSGADAAPIRRAALLETEIPYSVRNYEFGKDKNKPALLLVIQHREHNKVTDCSTNLDLDQKRTAALEMAKMYAINYQEGPVQIRGEDPEMAAMLHAALLVLLPGVEIKNYVECDRPSWSNSRFINSHFPGAKAKYTFDDAIIAVKSERANTKKRTEKIAAIHKKYNSQLGEGFFDHNRITELRKSIERAPDQPTYERLLQDLRQEKARIEKGREEELKRAALDDPEESPGPGSQHG